MRQPTSAGIPRTVPVLSWLAALLYRLYIVSEVSGRSRPRRLTRWTSWFLARVLHRMVRLGDPLVRMRVGERALDMKLSHKLPLYYALIPTYDRTLPRIARQMRGTRPGLVMIDVGANIGDTAALATEAVPDLKLLCIEGSPHYAPLLRANVARLRIDAECLQQYCADENAASGSARAEEHDGTGRLVPSALHSAAVVTATLDQIVDAHPVFARPDLLKIDTDGYDAKVLRGSKRLLGECQPVLFFEVAQALLREVGDDVAPIFPMLGALGYHRARVYDHEGVARGSFEVSDAALLAEIDRVSLHGDSGYCDILAWDSSWSAVLEADLIGIRA